jgi:hypothetical protein
MAVNESRSMNNDLRLGATDGTFKNLTPDRGGEVESNNTAIRSQVLQPQYGVLERTPLANMAEAALK